MEETVPGRESADCAYVTPVRAYRRSRTRNFIADLIIKRYVKQIIPDLLKPI
jgi:hypothetical protein